MIMIQERFYINSDERLILIKEYIRTNMPTCRFITNPIKYPNGSYEINISYKISDMNKLSTLMNQFIIEDNPPKISFIQHLKNFIKNILNDKNRKK